MIFIPHIGLFHCGPSRDRVHAEPSDLKFSPRPPECSPPRPPPHKQTPDTPPCGCGLAGDEPFPRQPDEILQPAEEMTEIENTTRYAN